MFFRTRKISGQRGRSRFLTVRDMVVEAPIGVHDHEKGRKQKVRVTIKAVPHTWPNPAHDNIHETVSYDNLVKIVIRHTRDSTGHIHLVETMAEKIAQDCFNENPLDEITVSIEKLDIYPFAIPGAEISISKVPTVCPVMNPFQYWVLGRR